ncbi:GGDEF domain-containing protein [Arsenicicoccus sp. oral taxon 190]|uniref:GGDEF domain-containing protein n=1 Tax=Arsenicicoccus sp. oral taxon 190 TaxID=1658671 RepID=UPI0012E275B3|nr:GGDEF domain-containing protein [Arsenicicoccus sp. oral taxon 190]
MQRERLDELLLQRLGLPGRGWTTTTRCAHLGLVGAGLVLVTAVALGSPPFLALGEHAGFVALLVGLRFWAGLNPIVIRRAGIANETILEGGVLVLALAALGPGPGTALWLASSLALELVQRHYLSIALLNTALRTFPGVAAAGLQVAVTAGGWPTSRADRSAVVGLTVGAAYGLVESILSDLASRWISGQLGAPVRWSSLGLAALVGAGLGVLAGLALWMSPPVEAAIVLALPLVLVARLVRVTVERADGQQSNWILLNAITRLASAEELVEVERVVLQAATALAPACTVDITTEPPLRNRRKLWLPLSSPGQPTAPLDHSHAAETRWLRATLRTYDVSLPCHEREALSALAAAGHAATDRITERNDMHWLARHDALTGLLNRNGYWQLAFDELPDGMPAGALLIDLDRFKTVNDVFGHAVGDEVLLAAAEALRAVLPSDAAAARWGGDEFVVHVTGDAAVARLEQLGHEVIVAVEDAAAELIPRGMVSASVGYATTEDGTRVDAVELLQRADQSMYSAKRAGRATVRGHRL